ncbi:LuxR C-terminal-related transcriptional regulator [Herbiconiux sp. P18]|uniref:LuxR C-terminal-related transcriptional regulator n=1 Tax=Herbiconiux liangxiaofengii TaxID=3342795 RepID=UPI0035BA9634
MSTLNAHGSPPRDTDADDAARTRRAARKPANAADGTRLHGRDRAFNQMVSALTRTAPGQVVLVTGARGVGRSALLDAVAAEFADERPVHVIRGRADLRPVALGALAPVLASLPVTGSDSAAVVEFHRTVNEPGTLLVVDDAELLDAASRCLLEQVVLEGRASVLVSRAVGRLVEPTVDPPSFWRHAGIVIDLPPLAASDAHAVVKDRLGPSVGAAAADEMVRLAAGSTRTLVELAEASMGACDLADDSGEWRTAWTHLSEGVVASLPVDPLAADEFVGDLLALLAVAGDLPVEQGGTSGVSAGATRLAEGLGYVSTRLADGRIWVSLAHPLFAPVVLATVPESERPGFSAAGADMLDGYPDHVVQRALLQLAAGQRVAAAALLDLARRELGVQRYTTAITLGAHAVEAGGCDPVLRSAGEYVRAQALSQIGRVREASEHFSAAWRAVEEGRALVPGVFITQLAQAEGNHLAFRLLQPELAVTRVEPVLEHLVDPALRSVVESDLVKWRLMAGQGLSTDLDSTSMLGPVETPSDLNLLIMTATLHTMGGNLTLAGEAVVRGLAECDRFKDVLPNARDLLQLSEVLVLSFTARFPEARAAARANLARAESANPSARGIWKFALAMIELHTGSPARAWKYITEGRRDLVWRDVAGLLPTADALSAAVAARTGRFAIARSWLDQLTPTEVRDPKVELYASLARAWVSAAAGRPGFAIRSLGPALQKAADGGQRYLAALVAYEAIRIEPVVGATVMLPHLIAARSAFPICESHARAVIARNDVLPIAKELAEAGLLGPAIDAARWAADHADGDLARASRAHRLADSWTVRAGVAMGHRRRQTHPRVMPLTDREWQLASGAASHRTSAELAAEYGISVRTVDNHLARIYKKLGIASRRELAAELGALQLDDPHHRPGEME